MTTEVGEMLSTARRMVAIPTIAKAAEFLARQGVRGVCHSTLSAYEGNRRVPPADKLLAILRAYGLEPVLRVKPELECAGEYEETPPPANIDGGAGEDE